MKASLPHRTDRPLPTLDKYCNYTNIQICTNNWMLFISFRIIYQYIIARKSFFSLVPTQLYVLIKWLPRKESTRCQMKSLFWIHICSGARGTIINPCRCVSCQGDLVALFHSALLEPISRSIPAPCISASRARLSPCFFSFRKVHAEPCVDRF